MIITHLKCRIERIFNKGVWNRRLWKTYKTTNSYRIFFCKRGRRWFYFYSETNWVFFFKYNMGVFLSVISLFFWHNKYLYFNSVSLWFYQRTQWSSHNKWMDLLFPNLIHQLSPMSTATKLKYVWCYFSWNTVFKKSLWV